MIVAIYLLQDYIGTPNYGEAMPNVQMGLCEIPWRSDGFRFNALVLDL